MDDRLDWEVVDPKLAIELPSLLSELLVLCEDDFLAGFLVFLWEILDASIFSFRLTRPLGGDDVTMELLIFADFGFNPFLFNLGALEASTVTGADNESVTFKEASDMVLLIEFLLTYSRGRSTT